jgi:hypothetical protein
VKIVMDCDAAGRRAAEQIHASLRVAAITSEIVDLWPDRDDGYDVTDRIVERKRQRPGHLTAAAVASLLAPVPPVRTSQACACARQRRPGGSPMTEIPDAAGADYTPAARQVVLHATRDEHDFGGWLASVLASVAAELGSSSFALTAGRPGSWEADLVQQLVKGTVGWDDDYLDTYKEPIG